MRLRRPLRIGARRADRSEPGGGDTDVRALSVPKRGSDTNEPRLRVHRVCCWDRSGCLLRRIERDGEFPPLPFRDFPSPNCVPLRHPPHRMIHGSRRLSFPFVSCLVASQADPCTFLGDFPENARCGQCCVPGVLRALERPRRTWNRSTR